MSFKIDKTYRDWIGELKSKVRSSQAKAALAVNTELIQLYWELGQMITQKLEESNWGDKVFSSISNDLKKEFPDMGGLSERNLKYCKFFFLFYSNSIRQQAVAQIQSVENQTDKIRQQAVDQLQIDKIRNVQQPVAQIPWGHNILIFSKCKDVETALFYVQQTIENQWSRATLKDQLTNQLHLRQGKAITNFKNTLPVTLSPLVQETLKDPYIFDFLQLDTDYRERDIENQLIKHVNRFMLELGKGFAYVGQQYPLLVADKEYFLDLLFYHVRLKCYVVIELKNTEFKPEYTGKLNFYLSAVDSLIKMENDNPTIGLLLCKEKNGIEAEFALRDIHKPIGISEYILTKELPENLRSSLPTIEEIETQLKFDDDER